MREDLYAILGVDPSASPEQIEAAYRRLARQYHPDLNRSPDAATRMTEINNAYRDLREPERRAEYDRSRVAAQRGVTPAQSAAWEKFATWDAPRKAAPPPAPAATSAGTMPAVSLPVIIGAVLVLLLAGLALVFSAGRGTTTAQTIAPTATIAQVALVTSTPRPVTPTLPPPTPETASGVGSAGRSSVALAAPEPSATPTVTRAPTQRPTSPPTLMATATPNPTDTVEPTRTVTATLTRIAPPPLAINATDFYNEQETPAGGRKFQLKLTILNQGTQVLPPPWRPRFLVMAGDRQKGWVEASYYGRDKGGVDISQQAPIAAGEQHAWSWYHITAGPDEWIRQVEFVGLGWRWAWTFERQFLNPTVSVARQ